MDVVVHVVGIEKAGEAVRAFGEQMRELESALRGVRSHYDDRAHADLISILDQCEPHQALAVRDAVRRGVFDGGDAKRCLFGILGRALSPIPEVGYARAKQQLVGCMLWPSLIEVWVGAICYGHTPANNARACLLDQWLTAYLDERSLDPANAPPMTLAELFDAPDLLEQPAPLYRPRPQPPLTDEPPSIYGWYEDRRHWLLRHERPI